MSTSIFSLLIHSHSAQTMFNNNLTNNGRYQSHIRTVKLDDNTYLTIICIKQGKTRL